MGQLRKIAFLDRDGVINVNAKEHCYITNVKDFVFNKGTFELLENLKRRAFEFIIITNQRGVARGHLTETDLKNIHDFMLKTLMHKGIEILDIFYCPHEIDSCECRKPFPGLLEAACAKYNIDLKSSVLISDSQSDIKMGKDFGISTCIHVSKDQPETALEFLG